MAKVKYKYTEHYRGYDIFIYRTGNDWWWVVVSCSAPKTSNFTSSARYFSLEATLSNAKKYADKKAI